MPVHRLFGLSVYVLWLLSAPVVSPALAQTVEFVHGADPDTSLLEETEARIRVTDPAADVSPTAIDMVTVTVTTALSGDSEIVDLWETYRDSGVFEGRIRLDRNATPLQVWVLETGFAAGPPPVFDTLTVQHGAATDTVEMTAARIQILDEHGRRATALANGDWVHVRLEDHVRADDPWMRDTVSVLVQNPDMGDSELLTLTETALRTGVFEGRLRHVPTSSSGDGVIGGAPFQQILAVYDVPGYPEDAEASATVVGSRVEVLGADRRPTDLVPESSPLRLRVTNRAAAESPGVETADVELHSQITGDDETVVLTETGTTTGIFEGTLPMTVFGPAQDNDGTLTTGELLGPPHSFDAVHISYTDDLGGSGSILTSVGTYASETRFTDAEGRDAESYVAGFFPAWVRVEDHNANQPAVLDTIQATVESLTQGDSEVLFLTETGQDTAIFSGSMQLAADPGTAGDGILQGQFDDTLRVLHGDALGMTASGDLARLRGNRLQFIDADGRVVGEVLENGTARVRVEMAVCNGSPFSVDTCPLVLTTRIHGDVENIQLTETDADTGVFVGEIPTPFAFFEILYNGVLEIGNSGSPEYLPDVITASAGSEFAIVPTAPFRLSFVHAGGGDAPTFEAGEAVGLRLEDHTGNDPDVRQAEALEVHLFVSTESELVVLDETGYDTGVYVGSIPSQLSAPPTLNSGTLDVEIGSRLGVQRSSASDLRELRDEAVVVATAVAPDSPVRFVDAYGIPTDSYVAGSTAYVRVEDAAANLLPSAYDTVQVTVSAPGSGDSETVNLLETASDSGIFEGSLPLSELQAGPGDLITVAYAGGSDQATIRSASAQFVDEAGAPTGEVLENGVARLRVVDPDASGTTLYAAVHSLQGEDLENVLLTETEEEGVFEGTVQLDFVFPGSGFDDNGLLETSNSNAPDYLGDELTVTYQDGESTAVTIPSRVRFVDGFGRVTATFAVGERVGVRVEDHNLDDPLDRSTLSVTVRVPGGDSDSVSLTETGYDTNVYEGSLPSEDRGIVSNDGVLQAQPGLAVEAERLNVNTPHPTVAQAVMAGAAVLFVDEQGRPAELHYERTVARVRVTDSYANSSSSPDNVTVTVESELGLDSETLSLTETGGSTGVFEGSISLGLSPGSPDNSVLETGRLSGPPLRYDTLTASYTSISGTVRGTAGMTGSRTWFVDAWGNETEAYATGTTAYVRVEDHVANGMPGAYDFVQVTLSAPATGDSETLTLRETTRDSGIFEGSLRLETENQPPSPSPGDGRLQSMPGEEIEVVHEEYSTEGSSSDRAMIRYASALFVDEAGAPTGEVLENGVARLRVIDTLASGTTLYAAVRSDRGEDLENVLLTETAEDGVYEGTVQLDFVFPGYGFSNNGLLETSNSNAPDYLGDALTVVHQDGEGAAVTIPSRVRFVDGFGRVTTTFAVGERVGVRVEDHNLDDPLDRSTLSVTVRVPGGDSNSLALLETGYDTNVYEGSLPTADGEIVSDDGVLQVQPGLELEAERQNVNTPYSTVARAVMSGAAVLFVDEQGRPAEVYYERTVARVRVTDSYADSSSSPDNVTVTVESALGLDSEPLSLTETGPSTGVFEGSMGLGVGPGSPENDVLETARFAGPPLEYDTLRASYLSIAGTVRDTAGMIGSRTWFVDAWGNETDSYAAGTTAYVRVEDHVANGMPSSYDFTQVTLSAPETGDSETLTLRETTRDSGIFEGSLPLEKEDFPPVPNPGDNRLQSMPGEEIEAVHDEHSAAADGSSSDRALIRFASALFVDAGGAPTGEVLENGVARLRVIDTLASGTTLYAAVRSDRGGDLENVLLTETADDGVFEGTVQLDFVFPGSGFSNNGLLETSNSGAPDYLGDALTVTYQDGESAAVTIPSRVRFVDGFGRVTTTFAVGERVGVRVEDHNLDDPLDRSTLSVTVRVPGGDSNSLALLETGYDTNVYEGSLPTADGEIGSNDGVLQVQPGLEVEAERQNVNTPYSTVARAVMSGAAVLFVDEQGRPAEVYYERTVARVRVTDSYADSSSSPDNVTVTMESALGLDDEPLTLTETGPSTGVFEGSIGLGVAPASPENSVLETSRFAGPPFEYDTLTASYLSIAGTVRDTAGMTGSRTWFVDAWGNETDSYAAGTTAYVRVENHVAGGIPGVYDITQVTLSAPASGDSETLTLWETARDSGIFEGSLLLEKEDFPPVPSPGDGRLQSMPGEEIEVVHEEIAGGGSSSDRALIRYASALFVDEAGAATAEVPENGVARLRVVDPAAFGTTLYAAVQSLRGGDLENVLLTETAADGVYEGTVQLDFVFPGSGFSNNGLLETSNSNAPDYLGDALTVVYQDGEGVAVTIPSRVQFVDAFGRETGTFAVGERVGVRVEDHNLDDPLDRSTLSVTVRVPGGDSDSVSLLETGYDTNVYEGSLATEDGAIVSGDGVLQVQPGREVEAERLNVNTPYSTVARAVMSGAAVLFVDEQGLPAEVYYERTQARVRVTDSYADSSSSPDVVAVALRTIFGGDDETLTLTETGPSTGVFEGSMGLGLELASPENSVLETRQDSGPPHEYDSLRATYQSVAGPVTDTVGTISSRTRFIDNYGNPTDGYAAGSQARIQVEDPVANQPGVNDTVQVTVRSLTTGDEETVTLPEGIVEGVFQEFLPLEREDFPPSPAPNDGRLQSMPGEEIEAVYTEWTGSTTSSDRAFVRYASVLILDPTVDGEGEVLENGTAHIRVIDTAAASGFGVTVHSRYGGDQEIVFLSSLGQGVFEGTIQLGFVPPGGAFSDNGVLETSNSGGPEYLQDELTAEYLDDEGLAVTVPSRIGFFNLVEDWPTAEYAVGSLVRVRVQDQNANDPSEVDTTTAVLSAAGDSESVTLTETFAASGIFVGELPSSAGSSAPQDGTLTAGPGAIATAEHPSLHSPNPVRAQIPFNGNFAPQVVDDTAEAVEQQPLAIDVLANDSDPDQEPLSIGWLNSPANGAVYLDAGVLFYVSDPEFAGTDTFTYVAVDPRGGQSRGTVTVNVGGQANSAPVAFDDLVAMDEDGAPIAIDVVANDTDADSDPLQVTFLGQPSSGTAALQPDGTVLYTPAPNANGVFTFTYQVSDPSNASDEGLVTVTVNPVNDPPVAVDDAAITDEDTAVTIAVLANDSDADNDTLDVYLVTAVMNGSAVVNADETVTFTPTPGYHGTTTFYYEMRDGTGGGGGTDVGLVTVTVNSVNDLPVAVDDSYGAYEDTETLMNVVGNDSDGDGDTLSIASVMQGANGTVTITPYDSVLYTPDANFHGTDSFTYTVSDGNGGTDTATVTVTVEATQDAPVANDDSASVAEDSSVTVNVLGNDSDADDDTLTVTAVTQGTNGAVTLDPVTYTPNANFHGADSFTYTMSDGNGGTDTATVTVTVTPVNDAPVAADDTASVVEDGSVTINVLGNDSDVDNDTLAVTAVTQGANGAVTLDPVTYTPAPNFFGTDSFTYTVSDGNGGTDTATVTVTIAPSNDALTANSDSATVAEDASVTVAVLANDTDPENDVLSVQSVTQGTNGSVAINPDRTVTYTPNADFHGADSFTYTASDGNGGIDSATVSVTVTPVNDAPVAGDDTASVVEDGSVTITVLGNDADADDDLLSVTAVTQGANGAVTLDPVTYTPNANFNGTDSFTYTISDGNGGEDTATVTVTVGAANDAPVANDDSASTSEDNPVTVAVLGNDTDLENDTLSVSAVTQGANGAVAIVGSQVTYTPAANFHGADSFTYTASDGNGGTDTATVNVTITPVNDAPVANDDPASVAEDGSVTVAVLANDTDAENDNLTVTAVTQGAHGTVTLSPVTYTPNANYNGADSFTYTISDGNGGTDTATVNVTVGAANDAPVANDDTATVAEDGSVSITVLANDTDLDNDTLAVTAVTQGANGAVTLNPVTYTPNANFFGSDSFTYTASDGNGGTDTATVTVTVTAVNDAPVAVDDSVATLAETSVTIQVRDNDTDVDSATLTITAVTQGAHGAVAINAGQTVTYTPAAAWVGPDTFTYTISDGAGGTDTATVSVDVQAPPRVTANIQVLYAFDEGSGTTVNDTSGVGTPLNLTVASAAAVTWLPGALSINSNTLVQSAGTATKVINASKASNEVTVEAWVDPLNLTQTGPAAIVTISQTHTKRDVTLGQNGTAYTGQLRTSSTGQDGTQHSANGAATLNLSHVVYTRSSTGAVRIYVDGTQVATGTLTGNLSSWANYNLALGGELSGTRYWRGELHLVAIYSRALTAAEVRQNWLAGAN